ncbi:TetR family transcriptional regulator [Duganella sp. FT80W]|uniref:TetR family transcriptional regulator n=1 Tax=Duganella guangzhouensis TaxID=2666084 RepID=A0A6I2KT58_9BURK|nr:TetR/AcrR family transcriptional regulator [Duganella guangzhouensis]MRW88582.1 TetR family transcriptional regulator [Duganella guangzhouensis]
MKAKTETRRQAILDIAEQVFAELGFERASMDEVSKRGGGSKATIYNYFASKEELFLQVVYRATEAQFLAIHDTLDASEPNVQLALTRFGERFVNLLHSRDVKAMRRLVIAEGGRAGLGPHFHALGPQRSHVMIQAFLERAMESGKLRRADSNVAAYHFKALLESELMEDFQFHLVDVKAADGADNIRTKVARAVDVFMAAYGPRPTA